MKKFFKQCDYNDARNISKRNFPVFTIQMHLNVKCNLLHIFIWEWCSSNSLLRLVIALHKKLKFQFEIVRHHLWTKNDFLFRNIDFFLFALQFTMHTHLLCQVLIDSHISRGNIRSAYRAISPRYFTALPESNIDRKWGECVDWLYFVPEFLGGMLIDHNVC